ncbi:MAG: hypothetical protein ACU836_03170 [Gammaproteobacteria bacterium]
MHAPAQLWPLKLLLIASDLLLIALLLRLTSPKNALLYAWNPLVIKEIAFTAHPDGLIALLLISAWYLATRKQPLKASLLLAMAAAAKASIWLIVPFLLLDLGLARASAFTVCYLLLYLPFYWQGATEFAGLRAFGGF